MPICVECRYPVQNLYTTYSKADDRSSGKGVRLTQCPRCKRFADKYVEHDFVVLFIDLVLIKPQVYRHLLFNRLGREDDRFDPSIVRLGILLLLFDVYLTWARIEKASPTPARTAPGDAYNSTVDPEYHGSHPPSPLPNQPLVLQYLFFLFLCTATTLAFHLPIRLLCAHPPHLPSSFSPGFAKRPLAALVNAIPFYPHPTPLSTALLVSSCTKLFPILLIIWEYDLPSSASAVSWAVIVNNIAALEILVGCGYVSAAVLVGIGAACRAVIAELILSAVGLRERTWFTDAGVEAVLVAMRRWYRA